MTPARPCVFVLDEDGPDLLVHERVLSSAGYPVRLFLQPESLLSRLTPRDRGCIVLGLRRPELRGLAVQRAVAAHGLSLPVVFVSGDADVPTAVKAMKQGAKDLLIKPVPPEVLIAAVEGAISADAKAAAEREAREDARARWALLSPREQEVCRLVAKDMLYKQIGAALGVRASTAHTQRSSAFKKLGLSSVVGLIRLLDLVDDEEAPPPRPS